MRRFVAHENRLEERFFAIFVNGKEKRLKRSLRLVATPSGMVPGFRSALVLLSFCSTSFLEKHDTLEKDFGGFGLLLGGGDYFVWGVV